MAFLCVEACLHYPLDCIIKRRMIEMCLTHITPVTKDNGKQKFSAHEGRRIALYSAKTWRNLKIKKTNVWSTLLKYFLWFLIRKKDQEYTYFLKSKFVRVYALLELIHSNQDNDAKCYKAQRYYFSNRIIKNYNVIINGKNF